MNNYKIRVKNEAESQEAQELFFELGAKWRDAVDSKSIIDSSLDYPFLVVVNEGFLYLTTNSYEKKEELTLPQLRDLAVLHRNVVMDATHVGKSGSEYYVTEEEVYFFDGMEWVLKDVDVSNLKPIQKPQLERGLISGEDALKQVADGVVQYRWKDDPVEDRWTTITGHFWDQYNLGVFLNKNTDWVFRLKPRTVKLEIEVPAPFEPNVGEFYYCISPFDGHGYTRYRKEDNYGYGYEQYGAWRTEAEIKIVVEQLRKIKEHSK